MTLSRDRRQYLLARVVSLLAIAFCAAWLGRFEPEGVRLALFLALVATPVAAWLEFRYPDEMYSSGQPLLDTVVIAIGVWLAPSAWHPGVAIGALIVGKSTLQNATMRPALVAGVSGILLAGAGLSAWWNAIDTAFPVLVGIAVATPAVVYYAYRESRRSDAQRTEAQRLESLARIAGGVGHDFNNLLMSIYGNAELVAAELPADHPSRQALSALLSGVHRASLLSAQLVSFSGRAVREHELLDLGVEAAELALLLEAAVPKGVEIRLGVAPDLPLVSGDRAQLQQVLMNLILNAGEAYGGQAGTIDVELHNAAKPGDPPRVACVVRDRGRGIAAAERPHIFEPFFSTKSSARGLGLSSVQRVVAAHGGSVAVESEPGAGSEFRIELPAVPRAAAPADSKPEPARTEQRRLLVVEDEPEVRRVVEKLLIRYGYAVECAADGARAIDLFQRDPKRFDAVVLDLKMPGMDGWECLAGLDRIRAIPVLVSSGYDPSDSELHTRRSQAPIAFINKPYSGRALGDAIAALFERAESPARKSSDR